MSALSQHARAASTRNLECLLACCSASSRRRPSAFLRPPPQRGTLPATAEPAPPAAPPAPAADVDGCQPRHNFEARLLEAVLASSTTRATKTHVQTCQACCGCLGRSADRSSKHTLSLDLNSVHRSTLNCRVLIRCTTELSHSLLQGNEFVAHLAAEQVQAEARVAAAPPPQAEHRPRCAAAVAEHQDLRGRRRARANLELVSADEYQPLSSGHQRQSSRRDGVWYANRPPAEQSAAYSDRQLWQCQSMAAAQACCQECFTGLRTVEPLINNG